MIISPLGAKSKMSDEPGTRSTRERVWREIESQSPDQEAALATWKATELISKIPQAEWAAIHEGTCGLCGAGRARCLATGWRCHGCAPATAKTLEGWTRD